MVNKAKKKHPEDTKSAKHKTRVKLSIELNRQRHRTQNTDTYVHPDRDETKDQGEMQGDKTKKETSV